MSEANLGQSLPLGDDGTSTAFKIGAGTWQLTLNLAERTLVVTKPGAAIKGDVNGDGAVDIDDVNDIINHILRLSTLTIAQGDLNGDGAIDIDDMNAVINVILKL